MESHEVSLDYKVPRGKMIRIRANVDDKIRSITINGDFFVHPEERIVELEKALIGASLDEHFLSLRISKALMGTQLIGVSQKDFLDTILKLRRDD
jgi:hypothetical protein